MYSLFDKIVQGIDQTLFGIRQQFMFSLSPISAFIEHCSFKGVSKIPLNDSTIGVFCLVTVAHLIYSIHFRLFISVLNQSINKLQ